MKYKANAVVEALQIDSVVGRVRGPWSNKYLVTVETDRGAIEPVLCTSPEEPKPGDYVIFGRDLDFYNCPADVFDEKYEVAS